MYTVQHTTTTRNIPYTIQDWCLERMMFRNAVMPPASILAVIIGFFFKALVIIKIQKKDIIQYDYRHETIRCIY